jgi:hypothetical protein
MRGKIQSYFKRPRKSRQPYGFILGEDKEMYYFCGNGVQFNIGDFVEFKGRTNEKSKYATDIRIVG